MDTCGTQNPSPVHILTLGKLNPYLYSAMAVPTMFHTFALPCHLRLPKTFSCASPMATTATASPLAIGSDCGVSIKGLLYPALSYTNTLYFKSAYNVQIVVGDDEPEDRIVYRFKKEVLKAGVLQECRRRRFFENKHDKIKRKARQASRRNRKRFTFLPLTPHFSFPKKSNYLRLSALMDVVLCQEAAVESFGRK